MILGLPTGRPPLEYHPFVAGFFRLRRDLFPQRPLLTYRRFIPAPKIPYNGYLEEFPEEQEEEG